jgi:hypothetical protein
VKAPKVTVVLFTYHRNPQTAWQRLRCLRALNPGLKVHGLYSGAPESHGHFHQLQAELDSDWIHPPAPPEQLWSNYDRVISRWFLDHGRKLEFQALWVHSWDLLLLDPLPAYGPGLEPGQVWLPGLRPLQAMDEEVIDPHVPPQQPGRWTWLRQPAFAEFAAYFQTHYPGAELWCEVSPFGVLGRGVCERYAQACWEVPGHNEYRFPSLAAALGADLVRWPVPDGFWQDYDPDRHPRTLDQVLALTRESRPARLTHPVYYPVSPEELWPPS